MGDLKASLKEAKMAIKDKDYEAAMIHCKDALKIDRKNYQALAMFGRVCLEQHRYTDSKKALLLATQIDSENPIAWQGLSSLHEKAEHCFEKDEEIAILSHLKSITKEEEKLDRIYRRLASVYQRYDCPLDAVAVLESLVAIYEDEKKVKEVRKCIIDLLQSVDDPSEKVLLKLIENYEKILDGSELGENESNYQTYLRLLYKGKHLKRLMKGAQAMALIFPTAYPLEWIARAFVEYNDYSCSPTDDEGYLISDESMAAYIEKLLRLYKTSPWGNLAQGLMYWKEDQLEASKVFLRRGCDSLKTNISAWLSLLHLQTNSGDISGKEITCRKVIALLSSSPTPKLPKGYEDVTSLRQFLLATRVGCLFQMGRPNHLEDALSLLRSVEERSLETRVMMVKAQVKLEMVAEAVEEVEALKGEFGLCMEVQKIDAFVKLAQGDHATAKAIYEGILKENTTNPETLFELGKIHFAAKDFHQSLVYLLKAAKYDPKMSCAFVYIGHYYRLNDNMDKARKCYEKAMQLNPSDEEAGASLSDVYRITGQEKENFRLLLRATVGTTGWAWLRLGLHYLAAKSGDEAVKAMQRALEISPKDRVCYECLGDAYLSRGSYTAALKVFSKAVALCPEEALYPRCQIARINHVVGEYLLSISEYEEVLSEKLPDAVWVVALVGLAEVLLTRAKKYKQEQLLSNMKDDCLHAIRCLARAACQNVNNLTVWKLLGDACTLQAVVPASLSTFKVPARLFESAVEDVEQMVEVNKEEVLLLGGRCYGVGLKVDPNNAGLWHDLGVNICLQGHSKMAVVNAAKINDAEHEDRIDDQSKDFFDRALTALKKSLSVEPSSFNAWNSLGVVAFFKGDTALSQHALLRSLHLHPTVDAWTHLGSLYLRRKDIHLAHEAFSQAQALDPVFIISWIGQAMVATSVGHYESFDLYRHTTLLGIHPESCIGFSSNVLSRACSIPTSPKKEEVEQFVHNVTDSLTYYTREKECDSLALNMLGLSLEMQGLTRSASHAFANAVQTSSDPNMNLAEEVRDGILFNYSRTLTKLNEIPDAIASYGRLKEPDFYSQCGLALSQLKASRFDEAYQRYTEACEWFAPDDTQKSNVLVALAFLQYKFRNIEEVKTLLFQSSSIQGLLALTSLGLLEGDATLTDAALAEIQPYADSKEYVHHVAFLKAARAAMQSNFAEGKLILSRAILRHPHNGPLWRSLGRLLLMRRPDNGIAAGRVSEAASAAAAVARKLGQAAGEKENVFQDAVLQAMSHLQAATLSLPPLPPSESNKRKKKEALKLREEVEVLRERKKRLSLLQAQRAVLMCPSRAETWAVLIASLDNNPKVSDLAKKWSTMASPSLKSWLENASCSI